MAGRRGPAGTDPARACLQVRVGLLAGGVRTDAATPATDRAALLPPPPRVPRVALRPARARDHVVNRRRIRLLNWG